MQEELQKQSHNDGKKVLLLTIDEKQYNWYEQYITGSQIKHLANIPSHIDLLLSVQKPWDDEPIANDTKVNLARPEIEHFFVKQKLKLTINGKNFYWYDQYILGKQIRALGQIDAVDDIYLEIVEPYKDELITDDTNVNLARPEVEHFISKDKPVQFVIIVNGKEKAWSEKSISFEKLVELAFISFVNNGSTIYTVTYKRGIESKPEGTMVNNDVVRVKNKMIFNVTATDKS